MLLPEVSGNREEKKTTCLTVLPNTPNTKKGCFKQIEKKSDNTPGCHYFPVRHTRLAGKNKVFRTLRYGVDKPLAAYACGDARQG
jgi:hypothetical protein